MHILTTFQQSLHAHFDNWTFLKINSWIVIFIND